MTAQTTVNKPNKVKRMVLTALIFALAIILSVVEDALPLPTAVPGVKFGLSNIAVMYALFFMDKKSAFAIAVLKSLFVCITRNATAGILSFCGGILSITVMVILLFFWKEHISVLLLSIFGALSHNIGQALAVMFIYSEIKLVAYAPVLLVSGVIAGAVTSVLLKVIIPAFKKLV